MTRSDLINLIFEVAKNRNAFDILEGALAGFSKAELSSVVIECGVLPEMFEHDSSEEKLWAKYSDIILSRSLSLIGINATVLRTRGNSADVYGTANGYTIVGDAKTFRLSRTAKNQKDFKVKALDDWRREDTYALLVAPLLQYPSNKSQIYSQAVERNVTLLSYTHLKLLLDYYAGQDLSPTWKIGNTLRERLRPEESGHSRVYWREVDMTVCLAVGIDAKRMHEYKQYEIDRTRNFGQEGIEYWQRVIDSYQNLSKEEAIAQLVKSKKIAEKIETIRKAISRSTRPYNE